MAFATIWRAASLNSCMRFLCVARIVPLPGSERPMASVSEFIEFAVNIPEQQPQPGQAQLSIWRISSSLTLGSAPLTMAVIRSAFSPFHRPASIGPPLQNTAGMFNRMAAISMPGVTLSQFEIHIIASALWALTIYSTESAMISRDGSEYSIPSCPIAIPSSIAIVLNSAA